MVHHVGPVNMAHSIARTLKFRDNEIVLAVSAITFDISVADLLCGLLHGSTVVLATAYVNWFFPQPFNLINVIRLDAKDGGRLVSLLQKHSVTYMCATPPHLQLMLMAGWKKPNTDQLKIAASGDVLTFEIAKNVLPYGELWNLYGLPGVFLFLTNKF